MVSYECIIVMVCAVNKLSLIQEELTLILGDVYLAGGSRSVPVVLTMTIIKF